MSATRSRSSDFACLFAACRVGANWTGPAAFLAIRESEKYCSWTRLVVRLLTDSIRSVRDSAVLRPVPPPPSFLPGAHTCGATPDPFSNSAVKPAGPMILIKVGKVGPCRAFLARVRVSHDARTLFSFRAGVIAPGVARRGRSRPATLDPVRRRTTLRRPRSRRAHSSVG